MLPEKFRHMLLYISIFLRWIPRCEIAGSKDTCALNFNRLETENSFPQSGLCYFILSLTIYE